MGEGSGRIQGRKGKEELLERKKEREKEGRMGREREGEGKKRVK